MDNSRHGSDIHCSDVCRSEVEEQLGSERSELRPEERQAASSSPLVERLHSLKEVTGWRERSSGATSRADEQV